MKKILILMLTLVLLTGCNATISNNPSSPTAEHQTTQATTSDIVVRKVENLSGSFLLGADISSLIALENSGMVYHNFNGEPEDLVSILHAAGLNAIRVRIWKDPYDAQGHGYGGGNCDLEKAITIGKRAMEHDMSLLVDLHYSDFWSDPGKQQVPKAWEGFNIQEKTAAVQDYTRECLQAFADAGVTVSMIQIGNETTGGFCGEWTPEGQYPLMAAAAKTVRDFDPDIRIAVHYTNPEKGGYNTFARWLREYQVDYDIFATSYYPAWHGTLENLATELKAVSQGYGKEVMVAETAWDYKTYDANAQGAYPYTVQGQSNAIREVIQTVSDVGGIGVFYWEPAWIELPGTSWEERAQIWERCGTGWASSFAGEYDPNDAGKYYGGSACVKQALFDEQGYPLESLLTFAYVRDNNSNSPLRLGLS